MRGYLAAVGCGVIATVITVVTPMLAAGLVAWLLVPLVVLIAAPVWLAGAAIVGLPVWWAMDRAGVRSGWAAVIAGAGLAGATCAALGLVTALIVTAPSTPASSVWIDGRAVVIEGNTTAYGQARSRNVRFWWPVVAGAFGAASGAASGFGLWRAVYGRRKPRPAVPPPARPS